MNKNFKNIALLIGLILLNFSACSFKKYILSSACESRLEKPTKSDPLPEKSVGEIKEYGWYWDSKKVSSYCHKYLGRGTTNRIKCQEKFTDIWQTTFERKQVNEYFCGTKCEAFCGKYRVDCCKIVTGDETRNTCNNQFRYERSCKDNKAHWVDTRYTNSDGEKAWKKMPTPAYD